MHVFQRHCSIHEELRNFKLRWIIVVFTHNVIQLAFALTRQQHRTVWKENVYEKN